jgi:hypothetical protein
LTSLREGSRIAPTAEYIVIPVPFPCSVALFSCPCGAKAVEETKKAAPKGWSVDADGSARCPVCVAKG